MKRKHFIQKLKSELYDKRLPVEKIYEILEDYEGIITEAVEHGKTEEEIVAKLGDPKEIALKFTDKNVSRKSAKIIQLSPFIAIIIYSWLAFGYGLWHPGWLVFFIIPISVFIFDPRIKGKAFVIPMTAFISVITLILVGSIWGMWHPTWLILILIPMVAIGYETKI